MIKYGFNIKTINDVKIENKRVLVRSDFDVSLNKKHQIANDTRIQKALPTIQELLKYKNKLILVSKLGRPKGRDKSLSIKPVAKELKSLFPSFEIVFIEDFLSPAEQDLINQQNEKQIILLENIRYYPEEKENNVAFAKKLASLADIFVLDAFAMAHRKEASVTGITHFLPSYAGLELENEINAIAKATKDPKKPLVSIIGGAKIEDKLEFAGKLIEISDFLLVGGGIANTFLYAKGFEIGESLCDKEEKENVLGLLNLAQKHKTQVVLPKDVVGIKKSQSKDIVYSSSNIPPDASALDIGPETQVQFGGIISNANTIIWSGPLGYFEKEPFNKGTDFVFHSITKNSHAYSLVGGGDTIAAISKKMYADKISHISTGGGAMLEFIENGTLPGLEALKKSQR